MTRKDIPGRSGVATRPLDLHRHRYFASANAFGAFGSKIGVLGAMASE